MRMIKILGIDLAKSIFHVHGSDAEGREVVSKRLSRKRLAEFVAQLPPCVIGMEACGSAHDWGRKFTEMGHEVRLVAPQYVKPYVRGDKTDRNDAAAIAECVSRPSMRFVAVKSVGQQEVQALHRVRERLVGNRTALSNELRGILAEFGYAIPTGYQALKTAVLGIVEDAESPFSDVLRRTLLAMRSELLQLDARIVAYEGEFDKICKEADVCRRLIQIPGVGPITATAIWAHVGSAGHFKSGRQFSAYFGLVPKQHSSGGKQRLLGITKRGDGYIRRLLIHGARSVVRFSEKKTDPRSAWIVRLDRERGRNKACVALANKNARVIWAMMATGHDYRPSLAT